MEDPAPAPVSTRTRCPWVCSSRAPSGVSATRFSPGLRSAGTPTITASTLPVGFHPDPAIWRPPSLDDARPCPYLSYSCSAFRSVVRYFERYGPDGGGCEARPAVRDRRTQAVARGAPLGP